MELFLSICDKYGYLGAFLISVFGNLTIIFPVPYAIAIYVLGTRLNVLPLGILCGLGSMVGEISAYLLGRLGGRSLRKRRKLESIAKLIDKYGILIIFLFAATPLPDDSVLIPVGMARFSLPKVMLSCFLGKVLMCVALAYAGRYSYELVRSMYEAGGAWGIIGSALLLALAIIMFLRINWDFVLEIIEKEGVRGLLRLENLRKALKGKER